MCNNGYNNKITGLFHRVDIVSETNNHHRSHSNKIHWNMDEHSRLQSFLNLIHLHFYYQVVIPKELLN